MDTSSWQGLLGLDVRRSGDQAIVAAVLERLRRLGGWPVAGLYLDGGEGECRRLVAGEGELPASADEAGSGLESVALPGARLLYRPAAEGLPPDPDTLVTLVAAADEFVVRDMRVEGLQRISEGTVFNYLPINIGDRVDEIRVQEAIRALYDQALFDDIEIRRDDETLIVVVKERPSIERIRAKRFHDSANGNEVIVVH